jgi:hypothetical protein
MIRVVSEIASAVERIRGRLDSRTVHPPAAYVAAVRPATRVARGLAA